MLLVCVELGEIPLLCKLKKKVKLSLSVMPVCFRSKPYILPLYSKMVAHVDVYGFDDIHWRIYPLSMKLEVSVWVPALPFTFPLTSTEYVMFGTLRASLGG